MVKGIKLSTFIDTYQEWHALVIGFCEVLAPWPARHPMLGEEGSQALRDEHHYYQFGRVIGMLAWLGLILFFKAIFS
jgi:hypothetical protein